MSSKKFKSWHTTTAINNTPKALIKTKVIAPCLSSEAIAEMVARNKKLI